MRHRANPYVPSFGNGAHAAAIETLLDACVLLGRIAIGDLSTALIAVGNLPVLFRWKLSNLLLIAVTVALGLTALPLLQPTWVRVK